jgi:hypothetical protein
MLHVENVCVFFAGIVVLRSMSVVMTPPVVSMPTDSGVLGDPGGCRVHDAPRSAPVDACGRQYQRSCNSVRLSHPPLCNRHPVVQRAMYSRSRGLKWDAKSLLIAPRGLAVCASCVRARV